MKKANKAQALLLGLGIALNTTPTTNPLLTIPNKAICLVILYCLR